MKAQPKTTKLNIKFQLAVIKSKHWSSIDRIKIGLMEDDGTYFKFRSLFVCNRIYYSKNNRWMSVTNFFKTWFQ